MTVAELKEQARQRQQGDLSVYIDWVAFTFVKWIAPVLLILD